MRAIVQDRFGGPDVLSLREVPRPEPAAGQALIRVHAASINARDWHLMRGDPYLARVMSAGQMTASGPVVKVRGTDFAGVVEAVGSDVHGIGVGATVYGEADAAFADYVVASGDRVAPAPKNLSMAQAAALPLAANTA